MPLDLMLGQFCSRGLVGSLGDLWDFSHKSFIQQSPTLVPLTKAAAVLYQCIYIRNEIHHIAGS
jgi:hypothetical protein